MMRHPGPRSYVRFLALLAVCFWAAPAFAAGPAAPTGVTGTTSAATPAIISWGAVSGATSYTVYRGATSGTEASLAAGLAGTTYNDTTATRGTTYYYKVTAVNAGGESAQSAEVIVDPVRTSSPYYQINAAGPAVAPFAADAYFSGGNGGYSSNTDDVTAVNAAPVTVYKTERNSASNFPITCTLPGLTPGGAYVVRLQMAENYWPAVNKRKFNVAINGTTVLTNFDVWAAANAGQKAVVRNFNATADAGGNIAVNFSNGTADQLEINALEVLGGSVTAAPAGLAAAQASATSASLTWGTVSGATSYNLYRSTSAGTEGSTAYQTGLASASYTDTGLTNGTTYYYKVVAVNAQGESALSNEASVALLPPTPAGVAGTTSAATPAIISWGAVSGATSYTVYRGATSGTEASLAAGLAGTTYNDTTAARGTTYYYTVTASNASGESAQSAEVIVDPVNTASPYYQINVGGAAASPFAADAYYAGGTATSTATGIDVSAVNAAPQAVYQYRRSNGTITYTFPGLTPSAAYVVRIHEADYVNTAAGQRQFNVSVNGASVLTNFDIIAAAGAASKAIVRNFNATADASGNITVSVSPGAISNPQISGLEVLGGSVTAAPAGLAAAQASATSASLTWGTVSGATGYDLYRSTSAGTEGSTPYKTALASASYTDTGLTAGTTYYYKVVAVNAQGEGALSNEASLTIPPAPTGVTGTTSAATPAIISWGAVSGATSYKVYRSTTSGGEGSTPFASGIATTSFNDTTAARGTTYYYTVTAVNAGGESAQSAEVIVDPVNTSSPYYQINIGRLTYVAGIAPFAADAYYTNPGGSLGSYGNTINVTAINAAPQAVYQVERDGGGSGMTYTLPGLTPGGSYVVRLHMAEKFYYSTGNRLFNVAVNGTTVLTSFEIYAAAWGQNKAVVRNFNATADASGNVTVLFSTNPGSPAISGLEVLGGSVTAAPASLAAAMSGTTATVTWNTVSGATSYNLYRSTATGTEGSTPYKTALASASYADTGLTVGTTYYYKVVAVNAQGESALSNEASATPTAGPTGVTATPGNAQIALAWTATSGATSYVVRRSTTPGGPYTQVGTPAGTTYTDATAANNTTYFYVVQAVTSAATTANSAEAAATPGGASGLLGWWKMDEDAGAAVSDSSGFANAGAFAGAGWATGRSGYAGSFNGASSVVDMGKGVTATANSFSVACWVKMSNTSNYQIFMSEDGVNVSILSLYYNLPATKFVLALASQDNNSLTGGAATSTTTPVAGAWYHLLGIYDAVNGQLKLYVNGTLEGSQAFSSPLSAPGHMLVGRGLYSAAPFAWVNGLVDDAQVYNRVLTAAEIATISAYPTGVTAAEGSPTSASLSWSAFPSAASYNLYRSTTPGAEGGTAYQTGLASASYTDTGLTTGSSYYYKVAAVTASGESAHSNEAALTPVAAPTGVTATPGNAQIALAWTAAAGATSYSVRRSTTPGGPYTQVGTPAGTTYTDATAANNTTYFYVVQAVNSTATTANSAEAAATPGGANGLLGWWKMDEDAGTAVSDSSGFANAGAFAGAGWATGRSGYAGSFNGASSVVDMGKGVTTTANSFSVACWVKMSSTAGYQTFISQDGVNISGFYLQVRGDTGKFALTIHASDSTSASSTIASSVTTPAVGTWVHLLGIYDAVNGQIKLYVNGNLEATQAFTTPWSATGHTVVGRGKFSGGSADWVNGLIDDARLYNRLLTAAEIATISAYPTGAAAASGNATATVSWSAFPSAASYNLYRATTAGTEGGTAYQTGLASASYTDTGLTNGTTYYYKVAAVTASGESAHSDEVSTMPNAPPAAPTALVAVPGNTRATLSWTAATGGGTITYTVLRSTTSGSGYAAVTGGAALSGTSFTDPTGGTALSNGTLYYYVVTATNNGGASANSNQASVTPAVPALLLTKRITAINGVPITGFVSDGVGNDANAYWPAPSTTYLRGATATTAKPGDTVEYTIYFLAIGSGSVTSVVVSNVLPAHVTFAATGYNGLTPTDGGSGNSGMALAASATAYPSAPTVYLSNAADSDRGAFYAPGVAVSGICTAGQNVSGVVVVNVVVSPTALPAATSAGSPYNSYGFVRYQVTIN